MLTPSNLVVSNIVCFGGFAFVSTGLLISCYQARWSQPALSLLTLLLISWFGVACWAGQQVGLSFPVFLPFSLIPIITVWLLSHWVRIREHVKSLRLSTLVSLQTYRLLGAIFLYIYYSSGQLSEGFAINAGWGDILTGSLALTTAWLIRHYPTKAGLWLGVFSIIGIGDLILAPLSAYWFGAGELTSYPINLIPLFLGPPFGITLHLLTLLTYGLQKKKVFKGAKLTP